MPTRAERDRPAHYHHGNLRTALVDAAWALVEERGTARFTVREVAGRVGVTPMAPYHHFPDKAALAAAVATRGFERLTQAMATAAEAEPSPLLALRALGVSYVVFAVRHPAIFRLMFGEELADATSHPELANAAGRTMDLLVGGLGSVNPHAVADGATGTALTAWSAVHGLATLLMAGQLGPATEENAVHLALLVTEGLREGLARG